MTDINKGNEAVIQNTIGSNFWDRKLGVGG